MRWSNYYTKKFRKPKSSWNPDISEISKKIDAENAVYAAAKNIPADYYPLYVEDNI